MILDDPVNDTGFAPSGAGTRPAPAFCRQGFTLVELLTVIAIIGILATLLLSALASAQKASRQARCISNLHQISLALTMYLDDSTRRPPDLPALNTSRYLPHPEVLICPADTTGHWGNLVNPQPANNLAAPVTVAVQPVVVDGAATTTRYSYLDPLAWDDEAWTQLGKQGSSAGLVACELHGLGRADLNHPIVQNFQGLVLRGLRDGAVVKRQVFWDTTSLVGNAFAGNTTGPPLATSVTIPTTPTVTVPVDTAIGTMPIAPPNAVSNSTVYPWPLFTDQTGP